MIIWVKNKNLEHFLSIHKHSYKHARHLFDIVGKGKDQGRKSKGFLDKPSFLKRIRRSIVARINIQFWKYTIPFGSINSESRIFLRFRSGASIRSLVASYDSVREHQPGVSYFPTIPFGSINPESRSFLRFRSGASTRSFVLSFIVLRFRSGASTRSFVLSVIVLRFRSGVSTRSLVLLCPTISFGSVNPKSRISLSFLTIPFGSINPESRIFLRFRSGVSTRSLVFFFREMWQSIELKF